MGGRRLHNNHHVVISNVCISIIVENFIIDLNFILTLEVRAFTKLLQELPGEKQKIFNPVFVSTANHLTEGFKKQELFMEISIQGGGFKVSTVKCIALKPGLSEWPARLEYLVSSPQDGPEEFSRLSCAEIEILK